MRAFLSYLFTPVFYFYFGFMLALFHPIQAGANIFFGDRARKKTVDCLNFLLVSGLYILGCRIKFVGFKQIPKNRPIIIVANHQSMFDIPPVVWGFRKAYPKFISKIELAKKLPSISYNLKHGKSALIQRGNSSQSIKEIFKLGKLIEENNYAACIFPEGTRSKTGKVKDFKAVGINTLLRAAPSAVIVPLVIYGHSQLAEKGSFPLRFGQKISYTVLEPIEPKGKPVEGLVAELQEMIKKKLLNH